MASSNHGTVKTRFCIISDTHTQAPLPATNVQDAYREPLPKADVLLHAGDITKIGYLEEYKAMYNMLKAADSELKIIIAGNHDITLDQQYYTKYGRTKHRLEPEDVTACRDLWTSEEAKSAGIIYLEEETSTFVLSNGAKFTIYTSPYSPEFCNFAFAYDHDVDRYNLNSSIPSNSTVPRRADIIPSNPVQTHPGVDIMMTHGPPYGRMDKTTRGESVGCPHLLRALERCKPKLHVFGHIHEGWGAERVKWGVGADDVAGTPSNQIASFSGTTNDGGIQLVQTFEQDRDEVVRNRCAQLDVSSSSKDPLRYGQESLLINASIMNVRYRPVNAPWLVDLDLDLDAKDNP